MSSRLLQTVLLITVLLESISYELCCPSDIQRNIRANKYCNRSESYLCLYDDNTKHNRESCRNKPEFEIPGYKFIIVGTLQGVPCDSNRYQPIRFWTNENSECVFKTSKCNGIGQLMYKKGTGTEDTACRCDYANGYDFVITPKNPCMCLPEMEDCTCYLRKCSVGEVLTPGMLIFLLVAYCPQHQSIDDDDSWFNKEIMNNILNKEKLNWKEKTEKFVSTRATKVILEKIQNHNCVLISGPPGVGKTANAYCVAFILEKTYKCMVIEVNASDLHKYALSSMNQVFIIDDVFGKYCCDTDFRLICSSLKTVLDYHANTKIIMTCRSQTYHLVQNQLALENISFEHCDFLLYDLQLSVDERKEIGESYIKRGIISVLKDNICMLYSFFPCICIILAACKENENFFTYPSSYIAYEVNNIKLKSNETYLVLALLVVLDNVVEEIVLDEHNVKTDVMLRDIVTEAGILQTPSKGLLLSFLRSLDGTFVKKCDHGFTFMHKYMFNMMVGCIGHNFIRSILKYGSIGFVQTRIQLAFLEEIVGSFMISVTPDLYNEYFARLTSDISHGNVTTVFANKQMCSGQFRKEMLPHFEKHLKAEDIVDAKDKSTVIHKVSSSGFTDLLAYFVKKDMPNINKQDIHGKTALHLAVLHRHQHIAEILLQQKADVHLRDNDNRAAIHIACNNGNLHMTDLLIKHKAHTNKRDIHGLTPLHLACIRGHTEVVELLAQAKAKMNKSDDIGRTPLYVACEMNNVDTVNFLVHHLSLKDIHSEDNKNGFTPLHIACDKKHTDIVDTLLKYGANVNRPSKNNDTPMKIAKRHGNTVIIKLLRKYEEINTVQK
ncbi:uncharacterized protein LOC134697856 [Mytilus trossulus]|uniref:uncharacterized protein LOC134697856 n=1 Tax=Mytilus trossulus TaxID=6551 RepID=UPI00300698C1